MKTWHLVVVCILAIPIIGFIKSMGQDERDLERADQVVAHMLVGHHPLIRSHWENEITKAKGTYYFQFAVSTAKKSSGSPTVEFIWKTNDREDVQTTVPRDRILVKMDEDADTPTVYFVWKQEELDDKGDLNSSWLSRHDLSDTFDHSLDCAVLTISERDCPPELKPLPNEDI